MAAARRPLGFPTDELARAAAFRTELRRFLRRTEAVTALAGLTPQRYDLLLTLHAAVEAGRQLRVTDLCEPLQLQQTAVTELVKRAVDSGLVERRPSPEDGRVWLLCPTPEGEARLKVAFDGLRDDRSALRRTFANLDESFKAASR
jgi:DNA-binding MarR family transcriptional regulator